MSNNTELATTERSEIINALVIKGDLSGLSQTQKLQYYKAYCERLGLDPITQPFKILKLQGRETLYCDRSGAQQLNRLHKVSHAIQSRGYTQERECYEVTARASLPDGRFTDSIGAVPVPANLKGEAYANAIMKAETKAKRRATLDILGLGILDETEIETIPHATTVETPILPSADELKKQFVELLAQYREFVGEEKAAKLDPDNWRKEQNQENFAQAIEWVKKEIEKQKGGQS